MVQARRLLGGVEGVASLAQGLCHLLKDKDLLMFSPASVISCQQCAALGV